MTAGHLVEKTPGTHGREVGTLNIMAELSALNEVPTIASSAEAAMHALMLPQEPNHRRDGRTSMSGVSADDGDLGFLDASSASLMHNGEPDLTIEDALSLLLGFTSLVAEVRTTSQRLLQHYGSLGAVLAASPKSLRRLLSECPEAISLLRGVQQAMILALRETVVERPVLRNTAALQDYLRISLAHEEREIVRLLFLDARNALLLDEMHSQGSISHAPIYPREIVRRLIETNATALIIVHNHPSGDPTPSADDIEMTRRIAAVLSGIGVTLQDSVVVGRRGYTSLRGLKLL